MTNSVSLSNMSMNTWHTLTPRGKCDRLWRAWTWAFPKHPRGKQITREEKRTWESGKN
jgi:hypothetical protein